MTRGHHARRHARFEVVCRAIDRHAVRAYHPDPWDPAVVQTAVREALRAAAHGPPVPAT